MIEAQNNAKKCPDGSCKLNETWNDGSFKLYKTCAAGSCKLDDLYKSRGEHYKLYKRFRFGNLVDLFITDSRTYRDEPEQNKNKDILDYINAKADGSADDVATLMDEARTEYNDNKVPEDWKWSMLGKIQKDWLIYRRHRVRCDLESLGQSDTARHILAR